MLHEGTVNKLVVLVHVNGSFSVASLIEINHLLNGDCK